jgi:hypothetical protein
MKTIGFGGTFYTLWDIQSETINLSVGSFYNKITATYYKNLSKDLNEAKLKAGTDNFDECLQGRKRSFTYNTTPIINPKIMTDCERLFWVLFRNDMENLAKGVREDAFNRCIELGYISKVMGKYEYQLDYEEQPRIDNIAYKFNHPLRRGDVWYSITLGKFFIGVI